MRATKELIRIWTEALVPVCNHSRSHAGQELKWLLQHAREQARTLNSKQLHDQSDSLNAIQDNKQGNGIRQRLGAGHLSEAEAALMQSYVDQRVSSRKPLQYILGSQPFMDLDILTRPPTLIPRWETEEWTARLAATLKSEPRLFEQRQSTEHHSHQFNILDICTGSGCIPLGLASALPSRSCNLLGIDIHPKAIELATENELRNRALLHGNTVRFRQADLLAPDAVDRFRGWLTKDLPGEQETEPEHRHPQHSSADESFKSASSHLLKGYNLVVSNPPYIAHSEYDTLEPEVAQWEDPKALLADQEGLIFYPRIANMAIELLHGPRDPPLSSNIPTLDSSGRTRDWSIPRATGHRSTDDSKLTAERQWRNGPDLDKVRIPELVFEIGGDHQVDFISAVVRDAGFSRVEVWKDLADRARCIVGAR